MRARREVGASKQSGGVVRAGRYYVPVVHFAASSPGGCDEGAVLLCGSDQRERSHVANGAWSLAGGWIATSQSAVRVDHVPVISSPLTVNSPVTVPLVLLKWRTSPETLPSMGPLKEAA